MNKQKIWQQELTETRQITDKLGMEIDPKVVDIVTAMRLLGFQTTASCQGHLERITSGPFVKFESPIAVKYFKEAEALREERASYRDKLNEGRLETWREMQRMYNLIEDFKKTGVCADSELLVVQYVMNKNIFLKCYGVEFMHLSEVEKRRETLSRYQGVMQAFAEYLKEIYFKKERSPAR